MNKFTKKHIILSFLTFLIGLVSIFSLFLPLIELVGASSINAGISGYSFLSLDSRSMSILGVYFIDIATITPTKLFIILQLIVGIVAITMPLINTFFIKEKTSSYIYLGVNSVCILLTFVYSILGFVQLGNFNKFLKQEFGEQSTLNIAGNTLTYLALIFAILIFAAFITCFILMDKNKKAYTIVQNNNSEKNVDCQQININQADEIIKSTDNSFNQEIENVKMIAETLGKYKDLLDTGLINEEEYNKIKKEVLNTNN